MPWKDSTSSDDDGAKFASDLLLPFAGDRMYSNPYVSHQGTYGNYWSSSPNNGGVFRVEYAQYLMFSSTQVSIVGHNYRTVGQSVRCVKNSTNANNLTIHAN